MTEKASIRVFIADDHAIVREGLKQILAEQRDIVVAGEAETGLDAVKLFRKSRCNVMLLDISLPDRNGIEVLKQIKSENPELAVLMLSMHREDQYAIRSLKAGAAGFLLKATPPERLIAGIETVAAGEALLAPVLTRRLIEEHLRGPAPVSGVPAALAGLTEREREVFVLMARGLSNDDICAELVISEATVKTHVNRILAKLGLTSRVQVVVLGYECGLVRPGDGVLPDRGRA